MKNRLRPSVPRDIATSEDWDERTFSRKIAWRCGTPNPTVDFSVWADKHKCKRLVEDRFDVARTYRYVTDPRDISASDLPDTFVMKAAHGWNMSLLVRDGSIVGSNRSLRFKGRKASTKLLKKIAAGWMASKSEQRRRQRETHYQHVTPGILFEEDLSPIDYELQLFLFDGTCRLAMVLWRDFFHGTVRYRLYGQDWRPLPPGEHDQAHLYDASRPDISPPPRTMLKTLERLCRSIDHVRADFFVSGGRHYFGEFTFTHNGGAGPGFLAHYDRQLGLCWPR